MYVPEVVVPGYAFPFLLCDIDNIDQDSIGWSDPYSSYDAHNIVFDVVKERERKSSCRKILSDGGFVPDTFENDIEIIFEKNDYPIFAIVKSWDAVKTRKYEPQEDVSSSSSSSSSSDSADGKKDMM
mmetsp:Transcript_9090/g.13350  ORF Transcript_9090/g.13350 Transcript_9090/m.13350 type:complete len:127 (+) Transcript_9090:122-502(+)